jgi:hypothetical protein
LSKMPSFFDEILEKLGSKPRFSARHLWWAPQRGDPRENLQKWSNFRKIASPKFAQFVHKLTNFQGIRLHEIAHLCKLYKTKVAGTFRSNSLFNLDFCFGVVAGIRKNAAPLGRFRDFWAPSRV